jgi:HPt (histidine-containing phosphotransfer) domain-containing protein
MSGSHPLGMAEFFALEAGEYLERLDALLGADGAPAAEEFVRLARALRGSALMASQPAIGRAASGLESLARALREGRRPWDPTARAAAIRAVDDLKLFVRRAAQWTDSDSRTAEALAAQLEQVAGRPSAQVRAVEALGLDAGARAFIAREGAAIASALDRAAQSLRGSPPARDPLAMVQRALEPLRGLAALSDLPPLGDLLDGVEQVAGQAPRPGAPAAEFFAAAAVAVAQAAREVAERGRPDPDAPPFRAFAGLLVRMLDADADVVPIESLFHSDAGPHVVRRGTAPARAATLGRLELVSHGEHMRQAADSLERAPSATQRELRAHALAGTFRSLVAAAGSPLADGVAAFAAAARDAVSRNVPLAAPAAFAAELRRAGDVLASAATGDETALAGRLALVTRAMTQVGAPAQPAPPAPVAVSIPAPVAPAPAAPRPAPPAAPEPEPGLTETADLAGSWIRYERLRAAGLPPGSLDELVAGAPGAAPAVVEIATLAAPAPAELPLLDIAALLYRGDRALARAQELRAEARTAAPARLQALIEEVCDLVALAHDAGG